MRKLGERPKLQYGSNNRLTVKGTVEALGDTGVGIEVCSGYESYLGDRLLTADETYHDSIESLRQTQQINDIYTAVFADMNGPLVTDIASNFQNGTVFLSNRNGGYWLLPLASFQGRFWPQNSGVA